MDFDFFFFGKKYPIMGQGTDDKILGDVPITVLGITQNKRGYEQLGGGLRSLSTFLVFTCTDQSLLGVH